MPNRNWHDSVATGIPKPLNTILLLLYSKLDLPRDSVNDARSSRNARFVFQVKADALRFRTWHKDDTMLAGLAITWVMQCSSGLLSSVVSKASYQAL